MITMRVCPNCGNKGYKERIREKDFIIGECEECGLTYLLNPPDEKEIYEDYYTIEFKGDDYNKDSRFAHLSEIYEINRQRVAFIKTLLENNASAGAYKPRNDFTLLDIGCGTGLFLKSCTDAGFSVTGIDVSMNALNFARDNYNLDVSKKTLDDLLKEGKKYDLITMWHVLEHIMNPVEELKKVKGILKEGGLLIVEVPNLNSIKFRLSGKKWKGGNHPLYHRTFFTAATLKETLSKSGFTKIETRNLPYILDNKGLLYNQSKKLFNKFSADAFLDVTAS
ncbi:MAG: class I SAM-dependent methyltransferase [Bacteroidetes bacterium]|nr:class I SAM-dependent methyltransferase [Bacteroidota bacterium]